eukprot:scpid18924/ scgid15830/ 
MQYACLEHEDANTRHPKPLQDSRKYNLTRSQLQQPLPAPWFIRNEQIQENTDVLNDFVAPPSDISSVLHKSGIPPLLHYCFVENYFTHQIYFGLSFSNVNIHAQASGFCKKYFFF